MIYYHERFPNYYSEKQNTNVFYKLLKYNLIEICTIYNTCMTAKYSDDQHNYENLLWDHIESQSPEERLDEALKAIQEQFSVTTKKPCIISFYPYTSLKSTVRIKNDRIVIRISDILIEAPSKVLKALFHILLSRATRKKPHQNYLKIYNEFIHNTDIEELHASVRKERTRKQLISPIGQYYDLNKSFERINQKYFNGELRKPNLSWSPYPSRRQLGYHDDHLNLVVISRWLDRKRVPQYIVDFIMYHELLHTFVPVEYKNGKRIVHTKEFRDREKHYHYYQKAQKWLTNR
jgi:hypothetical protein